MEKKKASGTGKVRLCGFLQKQSPNGGWFGLKRRWFSLEGVNIVYYVQPGDKKSLGFIHLPKVEKVIRKNDNRSFVLVTRKRDWVLIAASEERLNYWTHGIAKIIAEIKATNNSPKQVQNTKVSIQSTSAPSSPIAPLPPKRFKVEKKSILSTPPSLDRRLPPPPKKAPVPPERSDKPKRPPARIIRTKGVLQSKMVQIERGEVRLKQIKKEIYRTENEEMKILLKSLTFKRPFPQKEIDKQKELEKKIDTLSEKLVECEANIAVVNTSLQYGINSQLNWDGVRQGRSRPLQMDFGND